MPHRLSTSKVNLSAVVMRRGWRLVIMGHSLGAGVAGILALHYRNIFPNMHCFPYAPPGGLMSPEVRILLLFMNAHLTQICYKVGALQVTVTIYFSTKSSAESIGTAYLVIQRGIDLLTK